MKPHVGDHGYLIEMTSGGDVDWPNVTAVQVRMQRPNDSVFEARPEDVVLDGPNRRVLWRPLEGDLAEGGRYRVNVVNVSEGIRMVIADYIMEVLDDF